VELGKEDTNMPSSLDFLLKKKFLRAEIILLAKELNHATVIILKRTDWGTFCLQFLNIEPPLL